MTTIHILSLHFAVPIWVVAIAWLFVILFGVGRLSRIAVYDDFPPAAYLRAAWDRLTNDGPWSKLAHCYWCSTPWFMLFALGWFALGLQIEWVAVAWWLFWGWLALSYAATMIIARDEPADSE